MIKLLLLIQKRNEQRRESFLSFAFKRPCLPGLKYKRSNLLPLPRRIPLRYGDCHHYKREEVEGWHWAKKLARFGMRILKGWRLHPLGVVASSDWRATVALRPTQDFLTGCHQGRTHGTEPGGESTTSNCQIDSVDTSRHWVSTDLVVKPSRLLKIFSRYHRSAGGVDQQPVSVDTSSHCPSTEYFYLVLRFTIFGCQNLVSRQRNARHVR